MHRLVFNNRNRRTELHGPAHKVRQVTLSVTRLGDPDTHATATRIVIRQINKFNRGVDLGQNLPDFEKIHDLIRQRLPEYLFSDYNDNPWHARTLKEADAACDPPCAKPTCRSCAVRRGITNKGANTAIDVFGWIERPGKRWNIGYESETSHINSAMWSMLRLNHANHGLYLNLKARNRTQSEIALERYSSQDPDATHLDLGIVAMWHDKLANNKSYQPTQEWWLRTHAFHPSPVMPAIAVFVSLV